MNTYYQNTICNINSIPSTQSIYYNNEKSYYQTEITEYIDGYNKVAGSNELITDKVLNLNIYEKSIILDLTNIPVEDYVKIKANEIYLKMNVSTRKSGKRARLLYYCITTAYKELGIAFIPGIIIKYVGLEIKDIPSANSMYSKSITGYISKAIRFTPIDYIPILYNSIGITSGHIDYIIRLTKELIKKDKRLLNSMPHIVAAGIILYFMEYAGIPYNGGISEVLQTKEGMLHKMKKQIECIHNS